ncbi:MAG: YaaA family protein, partial [Acidimicrobiia bacterium]|nr:YaaA family protein [Acidimicrobiia bacterium]
MIIVLSPAKTLDYESRLLTRKYSMPQMVDEAQKLIDIMRTKSPADVSALMNISAELAALNVERY